MPTISATRLLLQTQGFAAGASICRTYAFKSVKASRRQALTTLPAPMAAAPATEQAPAAAGMSDDFKRHQDSAAQPSAPEKARTLASLSRTGVVSTLSCKGDEVGFPRGSVIEHVIDEQGRPIFSLSALSAHNADLRQDGRCSFTVMQPGFRELNQGRITITGTAVLVPDAETEAVKQYYLSHNPRSFWVNFGDFSWWRMEGLVGIRYISGFAPVGQLKPADYAAARPDPVAHFTAPIAKHMNEDHGEQLTSIVRHVVPLGGVIAKAIMTGLDRFGMDVQCTDDKDETFPCRVPFTRPVVDRSDVKTVIVEMTHAAEGSS